MLLQVYGPDSNQESAYESFPTYGSDAPAYESDAAAYGSDTPAYGSQYVYESQPAYESQPSFIEENNNEYQGPDHPRVSYEPEHV